MGVVYRGVRTNIDRQVAIKVMHVALPDAMKVRERFEREAQVMARLDHPHCVSIIDYGFHRNKPFVVMELVRGQSLHEMIVEQKRFDVGMSTSFLVIQAQRDLAQARQNELAAVLAYDLSLVDFEALQQAGPAGQSSASSAGSQPASVTSTGATGSASGSSSTSGASTAGATAGIF